MHRNYSDAMINQIFCIVARTVKIMEKGCSGIIKKARNYVIIKYYNTILF